MSSIANRYHQQGKYSLFAVALASGLLFGSCGGEEVAESQPPRPVRAMRVGDIETFDNSYLPGRARAGQEVNLSFRVAGPLITRPVNVGDKVKEGDVVARIDPRDFQVEVRNAEGQLDETKATLERAQRDYDRLQRIFKQDPGATSQRAIDEAREERDRAQASIKSLEATVTAAKDRLGYTYLKAPFDGTIVATYVENFQDVRANQPIVRLLDTRRIKFDVDVPENFISYVPSTTNIRVTFDVFPDKEVPAALFEIGSEASRTTRTYRVTLIMDQPKDFKILAGMAGKVRGDVQVPEENESGDIVIPVTAVFSPDRGETSYVWVIDETTKTVNRRQIQARRLIDAGIFVEDGLKPGELIVTAGVHFLEEGQEVRVLEEQGG